MRRIALLLLAPALAGCAFGFGPVAPGMGDHSESGWKAVSTPAGMKDPGPGRYYAVLEHLFSTEDFPIGVALGAGVGVFRGHTTGREDADGMAVDMHLQTGIPLSPSLNVGVNGGLSRVRAMFPDGEIMATTYPLEAAVRYAIDATLELHGGAGLRYGAISWTDTDGTGGTTGAPITTGRVLGHHFTAGAGYLMELPNLSLQITGEVRWLKLPSTELPGRGPIDLSGRELLFRALVAF
jgi:hypothetical protein